MTWQITESGGAVAWGKNHDPPQGAYAVWADVPPIVDTASSTSGEEHDGDR